MATITYNQRRSTLSDPHASTGAKAKLWAVPVGRFLFSLIFILSGINHFSGATISYAASQGVPMAYILVPISGALAIIGGLSVLLGYHARMGALLLMIFLVPVTISMHAFWAYSDPAEAQNQMAHFMKNLSLIGTCVMLAFYGSGPVSIDHHQSVTKNRRYL